MPRPRKWRKVCCMPGSTLYGPLNGVPNDSEWIIMSVEEYEAVRLIDQEGLTQEACAEKMQVARATVQNIYKAARSKLAESLVDGRLLKIEGGDFQLYDERERNHGCAGCHRNRCAQKNSAQNKFCKEDSK